MNTYRITKRSFWQCPNLSWEPTADPGGIVDVEADRMEVPESGVKFFRGKAAFLFYPLDLIYSVELIGVPEGKPSIPKDSPEHDKPPRIVSKMSPELQAKADAVDAAGKDGIGKEF